MLIEQPKGSTAGQIEPEEVTSPADYDDIAALKLVRQSREAADNYLSERLWSQHWQEIDYIYQAPRQSRAWEGTYVPQSSAQSFTVAKLVNSLLPQVVSGLFFDDPPFLLRPYPGTPADVTRAKSAVFSNQLESMNFQAEVEQGWFYTLLFGTAIYKWGWCCQDKKVRKYVRKSKPVTLPSQAGLPDTQIPTPESDEFEIQESERDDSRPFFEHVDIRHIFVDPKCRVPDIRKAGWVIHRRYMTYRELIALKDELGYELPSEDEVRSWFETPRDQPLPPGTAEQRSSGLPGVAHAKPRNLPSSTADPLEEPLAVDEYWDADKVLVSLQDKKILRNEANPFNVIPFYSSHWWTIPDSFYSLGVGHITQMDQRIIQGLRKSALDLLSLITNPTYLRSRGANVPTQQIRQRKGGIIDVDGKIDEAFRILEPPKIDPNVWTMLQNSVAESESTSGADQLTSQGNTAAPRSSMGRTAGGANILAGASASRLHMPVERFIRNVFQPFIYQMDELDSDLLPLETLRFVLGQELGQDFKVDENEYLEACLQYEVLAGANIAAKRAMAQQLPLETQFFLNPEVMSLLQDTGYTVDAVELAKRWEQVSEWKGGSPLVRPMTAQEQQAKQQAAQQQSKIAQQQLLLQQKGQQQSDLASQKNTEKAESEFARIALEHALELGAQSFGGEQQQ